MRHGRPGGGESTERKAGGTGPCWELTDWAHTWDWDRALAPASSRPAEPLSDAGSGDGVRMVRLILIQSTRMERGAISPRTAGNHFPAPCWPA